MLLIGRRRTCSSAASNFCRSPPSWDDKSSVPSVCRVCSFSGLLFCMGGVALGLRWRAFTVSQTVLDRCAFFVIVPGCDHHKRHGVIGVVLGKDAKRVFECFAT